MVSPRSWSPFWGVTVLLHCTFFLVKHNPSLYILPHKRVYQNSGVDDCLAMHFDVQCLSDCVMPRQVLIIAILSLSPGPTCQMEKLWQHKGDFKQYWVSSRMPVPYMQKVNFFCRYVGVLHISVHHLCIWHQLRPEEGLSPPGTPVIYGCEMPRSSWQLNSGPLEEQPVLLSAKPSFQSHDF